MGVGEPIRERNKDHKYKVWAYQLKRGSYFAKAAEPEQGGAEMHYDVKRRETNQITYQEVEKDEDGNDVVDEDGNPVYGETIFDEGGRKLVIVGGHCPNWYLYCCLLKNCFLFIVQVEFFVGEGAQFCLVLCPASEKVLVHRQKILKLFVIFIIQYLLFEKLP
jgi:hypothetical protein